MKDTYGDGYQLDKNVGRQLEDIIDDIEYGDDDRDKFWEGYETAIHHGIIVDLFLLSFESLAFKLKSLIERLDELFGVSHPKSLEDSMDKRTWEMLVIEWVKGWGTEKLYNKLYESRGEVAWLRDFMSPKRKRKEEENNRRRVELDW